MSPTGPVPTDWSQYPQVPDPAPQPFDALTSFRHSFSGAQKSISVDFNASGSWVRSDFLAQATQADKDQLLRHEQYHLLLAGAIAAKAMTAMQSGGAPTTAWQQYQTAVAREGQRYDAATTHGTVASAQSTWEANIDAQNVQFP